MENNLISQIKPDLKAIKEKMRSFGMDAEKIEKETSLALQILNDPKNATLQRCTKESILKSIANIAQVG